jgi:hypothetical protein
MPVVWTTCGAGGSSDCRKVGKVDGAEKASVDCTGRVSGVAVATGKLQAAETNTQKMRKSRAILRKFKPISIPFSIGY